jgi:predicted nuclease of predicted toxin-antitoxin system
MSVTRHNGYVVVTNDMDLRQILAHTAANAPSVVLIRVALHR